MSSVLWPTLRPVGTTSLPVLLVVSCLMALLAGSPAAAQEPLLASERPRSAPLDLPPEEELVVRLYEQALRSTVSVFGETDTHKGNVIETVRGHGSGVLLDERHVLTVAHVVAGEERVLVKTANGPELLAHVVRLAEHADLALLQLEKAIVGATPAVLGDSDRLAIGQRVIAIGNPFGLENSLSEGRVSGFRRSQDNAVAQPEYIQTDAAISSGNSGGPLFDSSGRVIGIAAKFWSVSGGSEGIGFAVAINSAREIFDISSTTVAALGEESP